MPKTEMKAKRSTRKPLIELTNGLKVPKSVMMKSKAIVETLEDDDDVAHLDRLTLLHSDLSSIIHHVDELVAKALKEPSKIGRKEIESLARVLSDIQSSLKPWPVRLQKAISSHSNSLENHSNQSLVSETVHGSEDTRDVVQSPEESKFHSMISPSPLVAWRGECNVDGGRQLFLLTPLPRPKAFSSNPRASSKSAFEKFKSDNGLQSLMAISIETNDDLLEDKEIKRTPAKISEFFENKRERTIEPELVSPPKFSQVDRSVLVSTPRMKMSPPKSCVLLEPVSESTHKSYCGVRKSTPYPVGLQGSSGSECSESSMSGASEDLKLKYPELFGIQPTHKLGNGIKEIESSPDWFMSPPKSCVLMEPSDEKLLTDAIKNYQMSGPASMPDQPENALLEKKDDAKSGFPELEFGDSYAVVESTPAFKVPEIGFRAGKHPGENTLKKELWMKFEAASSQDFHFDVSFLQTAQRGFLDRLEEVSFDGTKSDI